MSEGTGVQKKSLVSEKRETFFMLIRNGIFKPSKQSVPFERLLHLGESFLSLLAVLVALALW